MLEKWLGNLSTEYIDNQFFYNSENRAPPIIDLPMVKIFSRQEVDIKWVWLVEPPFENPGYGLAS